MTNDTRYNGTEILLVARLIQALFLSSLDCSLFRHTVTKLDFVDMPNNTPGHVAIVPGLAHGLWFSIQRLAQLILCAGNKYSPVKSDGPLPLSIPKAALDQISLPPPGALATVIRSERNPLLFVQDIASQRVAIATIQFVGLKTVRWIIDAIERSADLGYESLWDWAGVMELKGCPPNDFGFFRSQVIEEVERMRHGSLAEDLFLDLDSSDDETDKVGSGWPPDRPKAPIESNAIAELRDVVEAVYITFPALDIHYMPAPVCHYTSEDVNGMVSVLDQLNLTDVLGFEMRNFQ
jgi:hypothetical protein